MSSPGDGRGLSQLMRAGEEPEPPKTANEEEGASAEHEREKTRTETSRDREEKRTGEEQRGAPGRAHTLGRRIGGRKEKRDQLFQCVGGSPLLLIHVQALLPSASCFLWRVLLREGNFSKMVRDRFPFMLPYVENESNQFSLSFQSSSINALCHSIFLSAVYNDND